MTSRVLRVLTCLSVIVVTVTSHALPTQDTLVITSDGDATTMDATTTELTTEEPSAPVKLTKMDVRSEINMRYAHTAVVAYLENPANRAQEASFRVLLPETAFISGFVMTLDGKPYKAYVKEKEEAKNIYNQAVSQGMGAAHVATKARNSNIFTITANILSKTRAIFNLTYEELLPRRISLYNHVVNLHPGGLVKKITVTVHIKESQKITVLRVPEVRTGNEIDATEDDAQNQNVVIEKSANEKEATITFTPDLEEQKKLIQIYKEKSKERRVNRYSFDTEEQNEPEGSLGQFVVQYDVDRSKSNEILVNNGYFVHFFAPTSLPPLTKHVVFVLDISGSMSGRKMEQLIEAMQTILSKLNKGDIFNIVQFESAVEILNIASADESTPSPNYDHFYYRPSSYEIPTLIPPVEATPENIAKAKLLVSRLRAGGGTNIATALDTAIALIQNSKNVNNSTAAATSAKDNVQNSEATEKALAPESDKEKSKDSDNNDSEIKHDEREPIIIFLTDGEPTVGEGNPSRIIRIVAEKNYGDRKASIYSVALGEDADKSFLRKLSLKNDGFMRHVYEASDTSLQLRDFYRQISSPLLANVKFIYPPEQVKDGSLTKHKFRRFYAGSEAIVAGKIEDNVAEIAPHVYGICGVGLDDIGRKRFEVSTKAPVERESGLYLPLERLWAYLTIQQLLDERQVADISDDDEKSPAKKALALALKYEFVTELTSLVVVKPNATSAVDAESVDKVSESPYSPSLLSYAPPRGPSFPAYAYPMAAQSHRFGGSFQDSYPIALSGPLPAQHLEMSAYEETDAEDYGYQNRVGLSGIRYRIGYAPTNSWLRSDMFVTTPVPPPTTSSPLQSYHLNAYSWAEPLLNSSSDCISILSNGTQLELKLTKDLSPPKTASGDVECPYATDASVGLCVYLTRCDAARTITAQLYSSTYCVVSDGYAGVCCPKSEIEKNH